MSIPRKADKTFFSFYEPAGVAKPSGSADAEDCSTLAAAQGEDVTVLPITIHV